MSLFSKILNKANESNSLVERPKFGVTFRGDEKVKFTGESSVIPASLDMQGMSDMLGSSAEVKISGSRDNGSHKASVRAVINGKFASSVLVDTHNEMVGHTENE